MQTQQPKYRIYATILDSFHNYVNSDIIYNRYWGWSENPPCTEDEFQQKQFQELIDRINRKPFDSEKADKGTCFNELIDALIENRFTREMWVSEDEGNYLVCYKERTFSFPITLCHEFTNYFNGALTQQRVEAILPTDFGDILIYGVIDELMPTSIHDIKTTSSYSVGKFKANSQHLVYPYALMQSGSDVRTFEYNIVEFNKGGYVVNTYTEPYVFKPERDIPILTNRCEEFIRFLEENRELITDKKIFGYE